MGLIFDILTAPILGPIKGVDWVARKIAEEAERQYLDETPVRAQLLELMNRYDIGEISEADYEIREADLLERLSAIRHLKAQRAGDEQTTS